MCLSFCISWYTGLLVRKTPTFFRTVSLIALLLLAALILLVWVFFRPAQPESEASQRFIIPRGQATQVIATRLQEEGLVRNAWVFRLIVLKEGLAQQIQAGSFDLSPGMSPHDIAYALTQGTNDMWVTIPEGWRREEIAQNLATQELEAFSESEFLTLTTGKEGRLFPDTYLIARQASTSQIVSLLENTFERKVLTDLASEIETSVYDLEEALTMASIVEREARGLEEMRVVAGILWNRIRIGMPLQADATLQYAKGYNAAEASWWVPPLAADKQLTSPFNTYQQRGLPPRPIASPGVNAIRAALHPAETPHFYYLHGRDGVIRYATTLEEHNANVATYLR